jgi:iron complex outermembrane receptor protein
MRTARDFHFSMCKAALLSSAAIVLITPTIAFGADAAPRREEIIVEGAREREQAPPSPATTESTTADEIAKTINVTNTEDALKYLPNVLIRKRHTGDTQAPMSTRTSGVGSSARSLIYADGVLLSALIGNNNSTASPRWGMVAPESIERIDVSYGPFGAAYPGNSIGAVVNITTRMPEKFEAGAKVGLTWQNFDQYGTHDTYPSQQGAVYVGDRTGRVSWWLSLNHVTSNSQPLTTVTAARPAAPDTTGAATTGSYADLNRLGASIAVLGGSGFEHQNQDTVTAKVAVDLGAFWRASYSVGLFRNDTDSRAASYLRDASGNTVYTGTLNLGGYRYTIAPSVFSNGVYNLREDHWMHTVAVKSDTGGAWDLEAIGTLYDYGKSLQRIPSSALPAANSGGAGSVTDMSGTGWYTLDVRGTWRPTDHTVGVGVHWDRYTLGNVRSNVNAWQSDTQGIVASAARGKTETTGAWIQDVWKIRPDVQLTAGGRYESWRARNGFNFSLAPALSVNQPSLNASRFSPKASVRWDITPDWTATGSFGMAYRFPTVSELYQAITTGTTLTVPNPNLKPERAVAGELALERRFKDGRVRLSVFQENITDALSSQSAPLVANSTTLFNYVQNVDETRARGVELIADVEDFGVSGLGLSGSLTYVDPKVLRDPVFPAAIGKQIPQVPKFRATLVATYRPDDRWAFTVAGRCSDRTFATIDNSDPITHTYQGFDGYFVLDARVLYQLNRQWSAAVGVDNLNNRKYFLFHAFPQRTVSLELKYRY